MFAKLELISLWLTIPYSICLHWSQPLAEATRFRQLSLTSVFHSIKNKLEHGHRIHRLFSDSAGRVSQCIGYYFRSGVLSVYSFRLLAESYRLCPYWWVVGYSAAHCIFYRYAGICFRLYLTIYQLVWALFTTFSCWFFTTYKILGRFNPRYRIV